MANKGMEIRDNCYYTEKHEWVRVEGNTAVCGISDYAQHSLGDIVFIEIEESARSGSIAKGDVIAVVESAKAASDVYSPVSGEIIEVNAAVEDNPETVNNSPYDDGWFIKLELSGSAELENLLTPDKYRDLLSPGA